MKINLLKIEKFYDAELGHYALKTLWPHLYAAVKHTSTKRDTCIASAGAFPYIDLFSDAKRLSLQSFDEQSHWPDKGGGHFVMADRTHWPYRAEEADGVCLIHDIEFANEPEFYLQEAWRVLKGEGQLVLVVPNRSGKWARVDNTPLGKGYPFTLDQIEKLLGKAHFAIDDVSRALFAPPHIPQSPIGRMWQAMREKFGYYCLCEPGVYVIIASKHIYAPPSGLKIADKAKKAKEVLFPKPATTVQRHDKGENRLT